MEQIVLGFDGSEASFVALDWAAERASHRECRVEIIRVDPGAIVIDETDEFAFAAAEDRLRDVAPEAEVDSRTIIGRMPDALMTASRDADLLVIGVHRRRPLRSALTGWRPLRIVARSTVPTVVVPDDWAPTDGTVLVGIDDDDSSLRAIDVAAAEAIAAGTDLTVLHAWQMPSPTMDGSVALLASPIEVKAAHRRILNDACAHIIDRHPGVTVQKLLVQERPSIALLAAAVHSSLLVIGTHGRGVLAGAFLGSVAQDTMPVAPVPVCVVPRTAADPFAGYVVEDALTRLSATGDAHARERTASHSGRSVDGYDSSR